MTAAVTLPPPLLVVEVDHRVESPNRHGEDPWIRRQRRGREQRATLDALGSFEPPPLPVRVTMTRIGPAVIDDDNLAGAFKAVRDAVADWLRTDDGATGGVDWKYAQEKQRVRTEDRPGRQGRRVRGRHAFRVWFRLTFEPWDGCPVTFVELDGPFAGDEHVRIRMSGPTREAGHITDAHVRANGSVMRVARRSAPDRPHYINMYWRFEWKRFDGGPPRSRRTTGIAFRDRGELESALAALTAELEAWPKEREVDHENGAVCGGDADGGLRVEGDGDGR